MRTRILALSAVACAGALAGAFCALGAWNERSAARLERAPETFREDALAARAQRGAAAPAAELSRPEPAAPREDAALGLALSGRVVDRDGAPIAGAEVTWTALAGELAAGRGERLVSDVPAALVAELGVATSTGADGAFAFETAPPEAAAAPSVVWVTHDAFAAKAELLEPGAPAPIAFELAEAAPVRVRVVDAAGQPVAGARVVLRLAAPAERRAAPSEAELAARAELAFCRAESTDANGFAPLAPLGNLADRGLVQAGRGALVSRPRLGQDEVSQGELALTLRPTFSARGRVEAQGEGVSLAGARVAIGALRAGELLPLGSLCVERDGSFGPAALPRVPAERFVARLAGLGLATREIELEPAALGELWQLDFAALSAARLNVLVLGPGGEPLADASAQARWESAPGAWTTVAGKAAAGGSVELAGLRSGLVWLAVEAPGHASTTTGPVSVTAEQPASVRVSLAPSASLVGRCTEAGKPARAFAVAWWRDDLESVHTERFQSADGSFELRGLPPGRISLAAFSESSPRGPVRTLELDPAAVGEVALELGLGRAGRGRVVDATSGAALAGAAVTPWIAHAGRLVAAAGPARAVAPDGGFELANLAPAGTGLEIAAPGFAPIWISVPESAFEGAGEAADLGVFALERSCAARVLVRGLSPAEQAGAALSMSGANRGALPPLAPDGTTAVEGLRPFPTDFQLELADGAVFVQRTALSAEAPTDVRFDVAGLGALEVTCVDASGRPLHVRGIATLACLAPPDGTGEALELAREVQVDGSRFAIERLAGGPAVLTLRSADGALATRALELEAGQRQQAVLAIGAARAVLRVQDPSGRPVAGARVELAFAERGAGWSAAGSTDAEGEFDAGALAGADGRELRISLEHEELGRAQLALTFSEAAAARPIVVVFPSAEPLSVRLSEAGEPRAGLEVWLVDAGGDVRASAFSNDEGAAAFGPIARGTWYAFVAHAGYWEIPIEIEHEGNPEPIEIEVYPTGALALEAHTRSGPTAGVTFTLTCLEDFAFGLEEWMSTDGVPALAGPLTTDQAGRLELADLPAGDWAWQATAPDGSSTSGAVRVLPGRTVSLTADLP